MTVKQPYYVPGGDGPSKWSLLTDWVRVRIMGVALSCAAFISFVSLIAPAWLDFILDLSMMGLVAIVGSLARRK
jgi:hypothetical protein